MRATRLAAAAASGALVATCWWGWLLWDHAGQDGRALARAREIGRSEAARVVYDDPEIASVPLYMQTDERWGLLPYAGSDVAESGCGLACASMAWTWLEREECTPADLLALVGNSFVRDDANYMPGFCGWMEERDPSLASTEPYEDLDRAIGEAAAGRMVFASMEGRLVEGGRDYGAHIVLLCGSSKEGTEVHDPCLPYAVTLTAEQMRGVAWKYFISIGRN